MAKRNKKKLSSKQVTIISLVMSAVYLIFFLVISFTFKPTMSLTTDYWVMGGFAGPFFIYFCFYFCIFQGLDREQEERCTKIKNAIVQYLSDTDFKQVYLLPKNHGSYIEMYMQTLQKNGCKFYAKLTEQNNIYLVVKDNNNDEVYSVEIKNYFYFDSNFTF